MKMLKNILRAVLAVILSVILCLSAAVTASLACMRITFTNEKIAEIVDSVDFANVTVPDGMGGFIKMSDYLNSFGAGVGITFTDDDFNKAVRDLSLDSVAASFLQDCRAWIFDGAPRPSFDPEEMAQIVIGGLDSTTASVLSMLFGGQETEVFTYIISYFMESGKIEARLESLSILCDIFAAESVAFAVSVCAMIFVLIFLTCRRKLIPALICGTIAAAGGGALMLGADAIAELTVKSKLLLALSFPESTFAIVYRPVVSALAGWGQIIVIAGAVSALVLAIFMLIDRCVRFSRVRNSRGRRRVSEQNLHNPDVSETDL